jgi:hypothetical protein
VLTGLRQSVVVDKGYAEKHGLGVGDKLAMQTPDGTKQTLAVRGIYTVQAEQLRRRDGRRAGGGPAGTAGLAPGRAAGAAVRVIDVSGGRRPSRQAGATPRRAT